MTRQASIEQIFQAFLKLTNGQRSRLERAANIYCSGSSFSEPADLLHEVLWRAIDKERNWSLDVRFTSFMCNAIRSVADADRQRHDRRACSLTHYDYDDDGEPFVFEENGPSEEDRMLTAQRIEAATRVIACARGILIHDELANRILDGVIAEKSRKEICDSLCIGVQVYVAARARLKRAISKARARYEHMPLRPSILDLSLNVRCRARAPKRQ